MIMLENDSIVRHTLVNYISDAKGSEYSAVDYKVIWIKSYEMIYSFKPVILPSKFSGACMKTRTTRYPLWVIWWMRNERFSCRFSSTLSVTRLNSNLNFLLVGYKCCLRACFTYRSTLLLKKRIVFWKK